MGSSPTERATLLDGIDTTLFARADVHPDRLLLRQSAGWQNDGLFFAFLLSIEFFT